MKSMERTWQRRLATWTCYFQATYFLVFGVWPLLHIRSFQLVTGRKTDHLVTGNEADHWLVYTVALLIVATGLVLFVAAWRRQITAEILLLGISTAVSLAAIDVVFVIRRTISPIYLADAAVEGMILLGWAGARLRWR